MRKNIRLAIPTACSFWLLTTLANPQPKPSVVAILHANILDVRTGAMQLDSDVLISADRIASIGRSGTLQIPKNARRLDARNKFLIPGLWDMHVRMMWRNEVSFYAPLFIANGVTGVRDMGCPLADLDLLPHWRQQIAEGKLVGPRIFALGPQLGWGGTYAKVRRRTHGRQHEAFRESEPAQRNTAGRGDAHAFTRSYWRNDERDISGSWLLGRRSLLPL